nr:PREDICTED: progressive rod-cone degeneration protein isoform X2 [Equus przewalskii]
MCTTLFLLSTLAMLWRRRFANRVQPEPSGVDGAVTGSSTETDLQSSGSSSPGLPPTPEGCCGGRGRSKRENGKKRQSRRNEKHRGRLTNLPGIARLACSGSLQRAHPALGVGSDTAMGDSACPASQHSSEIWPRKPSAASSAVACSSGLPFSGPPFPHLISMC